MKFVVEETFSLRDSSDDSSVLCALGLAWDRRIASTTTPLARKVGVLSEHDLVNPHHLPLLSVGILQFTAHLSLEVRVPLIVRILRHLTDTDGLHLNQVFLVDCSQAPRLDELVWKLAMEEDGALLDGLGYPRGERLFRRQKVDVSLV